MFACLFVMIFTPSFNLVPYICFSLNGTNMSHRKNYDNRRMSTSANVSKLKISALLYYHVYVLFLFLS
jgi:hypothetical protein